MVPWIKVKVLKPRLLLIHFSLILVMKVMKVMNKVRYGGLIKVYRYIYYYFVVISTKKLQPKWLG